MEMKIPDGFVYVKKKDYSFIIRKDLRSFLEPICTRLLSTEGILNDELIPKLDIGRGNLFLLHNVDKTGPVILKIYSHGGCLAKFPFSKYFFTNRALNEFNLYFNHLISKIPVPEYLGIFWRERLSFKLCGIIVKYLVNSLDLEKFLIANDYTEESKKIVLQSTGVIIKTLHEIGIYHHDLQVRNILVDTQSSSIYIVDFDKASFMGKLSLFFITQNLIRLKRSFIKRNIPLHYFSMLMEGYGNIRFSYLSLCLNYPHYCWVRIKSEFF